MPQAKTEVALQFSECCAAEVALQHWLSCSADVILTKSCAAAIGKLQRNNEKTALQESGAFLPLSCGFQAPTFRHPRLGLAETFHLFDFLGVSRTVGLIWPTSPTPRMITDSIVFPFHGKGVLRRAKLGNVPSATTTPESLIWWNIRCYI